MKKAIVIIFFAILGIVPMSKAQAIIVRPIAPAMIRPACPGAGYMWVNPYHRWNRRMNTFIWVNGYWARPHRGLYGRARFGYKF